MKQVNFITQLLTIKTFNMKNIMVLILVISSFYNEVNSQNNLSTPFMIKAQVKNGNHEIKNAEIKIYDGNEVVETVKTDSEGRFSTKLKQNKQYTIEVSKNNYVSKKISISTKTSAQIERTKVFAFRLNIRKNKEIDEKAEDSVLDFPFALVNYNDQLGYFQYDVKYTRDIKFEESNVYATRK